MAAASYERFPNEGERGLFLGTANPGFQQTRAQLGKSVRLAGRISLRRCLEKDALVPSITAEIRANRDEGRDCNAQKRCSCAFGIAENYRFPEVEKPVAGPPFGVRLTAHERDRAECRDKENTLYPEGDWAEDAGGHEIQKKSLEGEENRKSEAAGGGHGNESGSDKDQCARILLPGA